MSTFSPRDWNAEPVLPAEVEAQIADLDYCISKHGNEAVSIDHLRAWRKLFLRWPGLAEKEAR